MLMAFSATALAHHSFAVFDSSKTIRVQGTIADFQWVNPHCWLDLLVRQPDGSVQKWGFEGGPPLMMRRQGISRDTFKTGDEVVVMAHPRKDDNRSGSIMSVTAASGRALIAPRPGGPAPAPSGAVPGSSAPAGGGQP